MGIAPKPSGYANTKNGKLAILDRTKSLISKSSLIISFPIQGASKEQVDILRKSIPKEVTASVVKNSLIRKASEGTQFEGLGKNIKNENMFFFIPEGSSKRTFEGFKKWQKETKRTDAEFQATYAAMENILYGKDQIESIVNLPTKLELITKIAYSLKAIPTKLALGVKAVPAKLGRAFVGIRDKLADENKAVDA